MKFEFKLFTLLALLTLAMSCGKNNESGKSNRNPYANAGCLAYGANGVCNQYASALGVAGAVVNLQQIINENPCVIQTYNQYPYNPQYPYQQYPQQQYAAQTRTPVTQQINLGSVIPANDTYVGVTSLGDVAVIVGNGTTAASFTAYLCQRPTGASGQLVSNPTIGAYTQCGVKYITSATMRLSDGTMAYFRPLSPGGTSQGQRFSFCQQ